MTVLVRRETTPDGTELVIQIPKGVAHAEIAGRPLREFSIATETCPSHTEDQIVGHVLYTTDAEGPPERRTDMVVTFGAEPPQFAGLWTVSPLYADGHRGV